MLGVTGLAQAQEHQKRGMTAEDFYSQVFLTDLQISPDGSRVAYVVVTVDGKQNRHFSSIWLARTDGSQPPAPFTTGPYSATSPRWRPDGEALAFLATRPATSAPSGTSTDHPRPQVHLLPTRGGEARQVTSLRNGVTRFEWSPDGTRLLCVSRTGPADRMPPGSDLSDTRRITRLIYKSPGPHWLDDRRSHLWVVDVASGTGRQVTDGDGWDDSDPQWSPDGKRIAFVSDRTGLQYDARGDAEIWVVSADGGEPVQVCNHPSPKQNARMPAPADTGPAWSPDGKSIAFRVRVGDDAFPKIWLAPGDGGGPSRLTKADLDLLPVDLRWTTDSQGLYFRADVRGESHIFLLDLASQNVRQITSGSRSIRNWDVSERTNTIVYTSSDFTHLNDLYVADLSGQGERKLAEPHGSAWAGLQLAHVERFRFKGADDVELDGFFVKPLAWQAGKTYPMILSVHGGPSSMYGIDWYYEFQVYAARGYAVLYTNPRGSGGYGERFQRLVKGEWGGKSLVDLLKGVDAVVKKYPWVDDARLGVTGLSYGGYMTNWIVGHTDRFKAAVTVNGISNPVTQEGTRFVPFPRVADFGGTVWDAFDVYWDNAAIKFARNAKTPTMIQQGENDYMVPLEQAEQMYRALKYFDVPTELLIFPRANHGGLNYRPWQTPPMGEPRQYVEALNWRLYWFDRYVMGNAKAITPTEAARTSRRTAEASVHALRSTASSR